LAWTIEFDPAAYDSFRRLDRAVQVRIARFLDERVAQASDPRQIGKALKGNLSGYWRYRVGDYRLVCRMIDGRMIVLVVEIGHRSHIYDR